jgi:ABC-2 type transport system permease protein
VIQPLVWLLLFGQMFKRVVDLPGFHGGSTRSPSSHGRRRR